MSSEGTAPVVVRSRLGRVVGAVWALVAVVLLAAGLVLLVDEGRIWLELPLAPIAAAVAVGLGRSRCTFDRDGVLLQDGRRRTRILWSAITTVEIRDRRFAPAVVLHHVDGPPVTLSATVGLPAARRAALADDLAPLLAGHGVELARPGASA